MIVEKLHFYFALLFLDFMKKKNVTFTRFTSTNKLGNVFHLNYFGSMMFNLNLVYVLTFAKGYLEVHFLPIFIFMLFNSLYILFILTFLLTSYFVFNITSNYSNG